MKRLLKLRTAILGLFLVTTIAVSGAATAQQNSSGPEIQIIPVQGNIYLIAGAGANIAMSVGDDGVLLVDTGRGQASEELLAAIRRFTDKPIRYIINTHFHADHTGGNEVISLAGERAAAPRGFFFGQGAPIWAHLNVVTAMQSPARAAPSPPEAWPTDTFNTERKDVFFNGESIELLHQPAAHTDGDIIVYFRRSDVIVAGDIFRKDGYPTVDLGHGGSMLGVIAGLNRIIEIAIPAGKQEGGTMVIGGTGRICDEADVAEYRNMVTFVRDRVEDMIEKGLSLEEIKAARPTLDYDTQYASATGFGSTDSFVTAMYDSLSETP